jgi:hypothetical protein
MNATAPSPSSTCTGRQTKPPRVPHDAAARLRRTGTILNLQRLWRATIIITTRWLPPPPSVPHSDTALQGRTGALLNHQRAMARHHHYHHALPSTANSIAPPPTAGAQARSLTINGRWCATIIITTRLLPHHQAHFTGPLPATGAQAHSLLNNRRCFTTTTITTRQRWPTAPRILYSATALHGRTGAPLVKH